MKLAQASASFSFLFFLRPNTETSLVLIWQKANCSDLYDSWEQADN